MASERQLAANRANGKLGGPKTDEGKAKVRLNALKHGLTAQDTLLPDEDPDQLADLEAGLIEEYQPDGTLESMLVYRLATVFWRLRRLNRLEAKAIEEEDERLEDTLAKYARYESTLTRSFAQTLRELRQLRAARATAEITALKEASLERQRKMLEFINAPVPTEKKTIPPPVSPPAAPPDPPRGPAFTPSKKHRRIQANLAALRQQREAQLAGGTTK
jgi:uncharacterized phage infection (PIP) family protein YhgE